MSGGKKVEWSTLKDLEDKVLFYVNLLKEEDGKTTSRCTRYCGNLVEMKTAKIEALHCNIKLYQTIHEYETSKIKADKFWQAFKARARIELDKRDEEVENHKNVLIQNTKAYLKNQKILQERIAVLEVKVPQTSCETQTETRSYTDSSCKTTPLHYTLLSQVGRLKFRLAYNRIWQKNYEEFLKKLFRGFGKFIMRAFAKHKPDTTKDDGSMKAIIVRTDETQNEVLQLKLKLENLSSELDSVDLRKTAENIETLQKAIEELRQETLDTQISANKEIASTKQIIAKTQSSLAETRQSIFELEHDLGAKIVNSAKETVLVLETALKTNSVIKDQSKDLPLLVTHEQLSKTLKAERDYHERKAKEDGDIFKEAFVSEVLNSIPAEVSLSGVKDLTSKSKAFLARTKEASCQTGFAVSNYEFFDLTQVAAKISKFGATLPELVGQAQNIDITLKSQAAVMNEARDLIAELRSVTREKLHETIKAKREEEARWLVAAESERRKTQKTNKKARLSVARNAIKTREEKIDSELHHAVPKVVNFVKEWNSLTIGDIFLYKGMELKIDETFNPSIRIGHFGQDGDKWEVQKNANTTWYYRGITTSFK